MRRSLSIVLVLLAGLALGAVFATPQKGGKTPSGTGGVCATADWACVSECISEQCADTCLKKSCQRVIDALVSCSKSQGCEPADTDASCIRKECTPLCKTAFGPPSKKKVAPKFDPCPGLAAQVKDVPKAIVGSWELSSASLEPGDAGTKDDREDRLPRPDYARSLRITPEGCFVLESPLEDATLGEGNRVTVRSWGTLQVQGKSRIRFLTTGAHAQGNACGVDVSQDLSRSKFIQPTYDWSVESKVLSLTGRDPPKTSFQFDQKGE